MKSRLPILQEIEELVAFLPRLYTDGFTPIKRWGGGTQRQDGVFTIPWPEYDEIVEGFFRVASSECWCDYKYHPEEVFQMLENEEVVRQASLAQIRTMLTFCVRGERFCDGHWAAMIEGGYVRRLLERLIELKPQNAQQGVPADGLPPAAEL